MITESNMLQLFDLLYSGIVFTIGPCGLIPVRLSIFCPDLGKSVPLFKILMGGGSGHCGTWSGCLLEVDDSFLNSRVHSIRCIIPECVFDT